MLHTYRYNLDKIVKIIELLPADNVVETFIALKDVLSLINNADIIIELILMGLEIVRKGGKNNHVNNLSEELIKLFKPQFKSIFKFEDLKLLLTILTSNDSKSYDNDLNLLKKSRILYARALVHVNKNSDDLTEILHLLYQADRSDYINLQNEQWAKAHAIECRFAFLAGSIRMESTSYTFFKLNDKKNICEMIFDRAGIGLK